MSEAAPARLDQALLLGRYRPVRPLGSGGSGSVWLARDDRSGREVAVKIVPREGKSGSRARREAQALAQLAHPRCLRAYACGRDSDNVYIAYEYVAGKTFREALRANTLSDDDAIEAAAQVLEGLAHAHAKGIVHRDVKPANVLLANGDGISVRLLDFGLARVAHSETLTAVGDVPGTLAYIAPERLHGAAAAPASDVWSAALLLYEALAGRHPFWRTTLPETAEAITQGARPLAELRPDLPRPVLSAIDRALALDPAKRPSAARLARQLRWSRRGNSAAGTLGALERRFGPPAFAGIYAGAGAALLPFYPAHTAGILAAAACALTFFVPRAGVALALAVPLLPLGNVALALALLYAAVAIAWLALHVREPERTPYVALGPLLGPFAGMLPFAYRDVRSPLMRAVGAGAAVLLAAGVRAVRDGPIGLGLPASRDPVAAAGVLARAIPPSLALETLAFALAAAALPLALSRGRWGLAGWGAAVLPALLLPVNPLALLACVWLTCGALAART